VVYFKVNPFGWPRIMSQLNSQVGQPVCGHKSEHSNVNLIGEGRKTLKNKCNVDIALF
jgi:hypothetical protein